MIESSIAQIAKLLAEAVAGASLVVQTENVDKISDEANKQALELQMAHAQAKVAQEIAIAQRIANASEVVIEEYYADEQTGEGKVKATASGAELSGSAEARQVTKRIYRFVGETVRGANDVFDQNPE